MFKWSKPAPHLYEMQFEGALTPEEQIEFLDVLDRVSSEDTPFVILTLSNGNSPLTPDNKKRMNFWFKDNKEYLAKMCIGTVRVQPGFEDNHYEGSNLQKGMPFPLYARADRDAGYALALQLLEENKD